MKRPTKITLRCCTCSHFPKPRTRFYSDYNGIYDSSHISTAGGPIRRRRWSPAMVLLCLMPPVAFSLGVWQVKRLNWKENLIEDLTKKLELPAMRLPSYVDTEAIPEFAYRRVVIKGHFDHTREILLGPVTRQNKLCYMVITPFVRESEANEVDGERSKDILVNRGYIPKEFRDPSTRPDSLIKGMITTVGMLRSQQARGWNTAYNQPERGEWQFSDINQMAQWTKCQDVLVDEIFLGDTVELKERMIKGIPVGRDPSIQLRNMHAAYAGTWFSLSGGTAIMLWRLLRR